MGETAVVVPVPEAEPAVGRHRRAHTPSGADGMPAHITILVPFADGAGLGAEVVGDLGETLADFAPFRFAITRLARFAGPPSVLYGAPEPAAPFVRLTDRLHDRFGFPPYGGLHTTVIPTPHDRHQARRHGARPHRSRRRAGASDRVLGGCMRGVGARRRLVAGDAPDSVRVGRERCRCPVRWRSTTISCESGLAGVVVLSPANARVPCTGTRLRPARTHPSPSAAEAVRASARPGGRRRPGRQTDLIPAAGRPAART
jgi:hypothetical protein